MSLGRSRSRVDGNFQRGAKSKLREMCKTKELAPEVVLGAMLEALSEDAFDQAVSFDLEWFLSQITPAKEGLRLSVAGLPKECGLDGPEMAKMVTCGHCALLTYRMKKSSLSMAGLK